MERPDYLSVAKAIFAERFPDAACAFIAGSIVTGHGTPSSDIDIIVLYDDEEHETYRDSLMRDGWPVELFVHNLKSQDFFFNDDIRRGQCSTMTMVLTGHIIGSNTELGQKRKTLAETMIAVGPGLLPDEAIDRIRYGITDMLDDLRHPKDPDYRAGILSELFGKVGDFYLRSQNKWSGSGKQLVKILKREDLAFAQSYLSAFRTAQDGDIGALEELIQKVLAPYGGLLFENYKSITESWKS